MQFSSTLRTSRATAIYTLMSTTGAAVPSLQVYYLSSGVLPGVANVATGTLLVTLPVTWNSPGGGTNQITFSATSTNASFAGGPFTPSYCRLLAGGSALTAHIEGTAGIQPTVSTVFGTVTVSGGVITNIAITNPGAGYAPSTTYNVIIVNPIGGDGQGAIFTYTTNSSGTPTTLNVVNGGTNYPASGVTALMPQPYDFMFNATVANGGLISLSAGTITEGNS